MDMRTILISLLCVALVSIVAAIVLLIVNIKKHKFGFTIAQLFVLAVITVLLAILIMISKPIGYTTNSKGQEVKSVKTIDNTYRVVFDDGKAAYTSNLLYGKEARYFESCDIECKTIFGFTVHKTESLIVIQPDVEGFADMSDSEQQSIVDEYNDWELGKQ